MGMRCIRRYQSPLGPILLSAEDAYLTGLWFEGQAHAAHRPTEERDAAELPVLCRAEAWLDAYFSGGTPRFEVPLRWTGTPFQREVWELLRGIPYGTVVTYGELAARIAQRRGMPNMSAQAVGGAVGRNPIAIIVPCHRVVGRDRCLVGYAGGVDRKRALLRLEEVGLASQ